MENKKNLLLILQCEKIKQRFIIFSNKKKESNILLISKSFCYFTTTKKVY